MGAPNAGVYNLTSLNGSIKPLQEDPSFFFSFASDHKCELTSISNLYEIVKCVKVTGGMLG